ncbi:MAG TPA: type VI secretion system tip protein TssI/VgrG, partial [Advenella sp.]|nr:type VI secretion system tip protein TssI/VgrG [Advenella sp.]
MTDGRVSSPLNARLITVSVNGHPEFLFDAMQGQDGLSTLSEYTVRLLHRSADLYGDTLLGKALTLRIQTPDAQRYLNGLIADLRYDGPASEVDRYHAYTAVVMPWFWLADGNKDYRIYQNQSVPEIIKAVLTSYGDAFEFALVQTYAPRIYCVQYGESDFAFVSRLLEEEGIHYYFRHEEKRHVLVMSDDVLTHTTVPGYEQLRYFPEDKLALPQQDYATGIRSRERHRPGRYATSDYDFKKSRADLHMNSRIELPHEHSRNEVYEWQGNYDDQELGERYARQRMQELHHERNIRTLRSTARGVTTGALFTLTHCPRTQDNRQ